MKIEIVVRSDRSKMGVTHYYVIVVMYMHVSFLNEIWDLF